MYPCLFRKVYCEVLNVHGNAFLMLYGEVILVLPNTIQLPCPQIFSASSLLVNFNKSHVYISYVLYHVLPIYGVGIM